MKQKKVLTSIIAIALAGGVLFGGTFAWQSISQTALNEVSASINPGGRLHDDFVDITYNEDGTQAYDTMTLNKDVYVENFTDLASNGVQVFTRVRLDEYMELGKGAGVLNDDGTKSDKNQAVSLIAGATLEDKSTWTPHVYGTDDPFHEYWAWDMSGKTTYMPTFNKNKDSLEADINGSFSDNFASYVDYSDSKYAEGADGRSAVAVYDADAAEEGQEEQDELANAGIPVETVISGENPLDNSWDKYVERVNETHYARETIDGYVLTMADYMDKLENDDTFDGTGNFWVYDADGWAYWANPIDPDTATGLLLDQIQRTDKIINQDWYYAVNVVAQFVTGDDLGQADNTGFYDLTEGKAPTANALVLLNNIGVDVNFEVATAEDLAEALAAGGTVTLTENVELTAPLTVTKDTVLNLNGKTITPADGTVVWDDAADVWSLISVKGEGVTLIINGEDGTVQAAENDSYCVDVQDGAKVVINGGTYVGNIAAVYVHTGEAAITGGTFSIQQLSNVEGAAYKYVLNCLDENYANGTAKITVSGGTFVGFDPSAEIEAVPGNYLPDNGYTVQLGVDSNGSVTYTVVKTSV